MTYRIRVVPVVHEQFRAIPAGLRTAVAAQIRQLGLSPTRFSQPTRIPYPEKSQLCEQIHHHEGKDYRVVVVFQYAMDEERLLLLQIRVAPVE